jgi:hypothetical protein
MISQAFRCKKENRGMIKTDTIVILAFRTRIFLSTAQTLPMQRKQIVSPALMIEWGIE